MDILNVFKKLGWFALVLSALIYGAVGYLIGLVADHFLASNLTWVFTAIGVAVALIKLIMMRIFIGSMDDKSRRRKF